MPSAIWSTSMRSSDMSKMVGESMISEIPKAWMPTCARTSLRYIHSHLHLEPACQLVVSGSRCWKELNGLDKAIDQAGNAYRYRIKLDRWPKILNVTPSHSLLGPLYGPKCALWRRHIPHWVNLMAQNVTKNCSKTATRSKKMFKNSKNRKCDAVTFLIGLTLWPRIYVANSVTASKNCLFSDGVTWWGHRSNLIQDIK